MPENTNFSSPPSGNFQQFMERLGIVWFIWLVIVGVSFHLNSEKLLRGDLVGNDDYMRLAQIRDWLGGQSWFDLHQYRLYPDSPLLSHWSRLPDVLIGTPIKLLTPFFGAQTAEIITVAAYPSILFLILLLVLVSLTRTLTKTASGPLAAAFMAPLSIQTSMQFQMGRIDHHGLQIIMAALCCLFIIKSTEKSKYAIFAGAISGLALYVGVESAPVVAAACISMALVWVFDENNGALRMRQFGLSLAAVTFACLLISSPPSRWFIPSCDAISIVYTQLTISVGLSLWLLSLISGKTKKPMVRFGLASALGLIALVATVMLFPNCLKGPYAEVDPRIVEVWLYNVAEAQPFHIFFAKGVTSGMMGITVPLFAIIGFILYHKQTGKGLSIASRTMLLFVVVSFLAGLIQTRLMAFASGLAIPLAAYLLATSMDWAEKFKSMFVRIALRMGFIIALAPIVLPLIVGSFFETEAVQTSAAENSTTENEKLTCTSQPVLSKLNELPTGLVITLVDLGAPVLHFTKHSVTTAPYHRNTRGFIASFDMFIENEATAKASVDRLNANYVIFCNEMNETENLVDDFPDSMLAKLKSGYVPDWLEKANIESNDDLMVYRILETE